MGRERRVVPAGSVLEPPAETSAAKQYVDRVKGGDSAPPQGQDVASIEIPDFGGGVQPGAVEPAAEPIGEITAARGFSMPEDLSELFDGSSDVTSLRMPTELMQTLREFAKFKDDKMGHVTALGIVMVLELDDEEYAKRMDQIWQLFRDSQRRGRLAS